MEGITHPQAVSTFCLFPTNVSFCASQSSPTAFAGFPMLPPASSPPRPAHICATAFSFHLHPFVSSKPARISTPSTVLLSPSPRRLPGREPRWCSGEAASSGSLSLQDGSMALLCPIWPRPILAPVYDCAPAGGRQSWRTKPCQYTADLREDEPTRDGPTWHDWILQYHLCPLEGGTTQMRLSNTRSTWTFKENANLIYFYTNLLQTYVSGSFGVLTDQCNGRRIKVQHNTCVSRVKNAHIHFNLYKFVPDTHQLSMKSPHFIPFSFKSLFFLGGF